MGEGEDSGASLGAPISEDEQFRLLVQGVTDYAIYMLDNDGRVASWNAGAQRIKGYAPHEIIGEHFSRFYTETERIAGVPIEGLEIARREGRWEREGLRVRKDGTTFLANVVIDAIRDPAGRVIGFAKVTRDITERRLAQAALDKAREALFQSQKLEAIGQLTGGVAHDFNNLLMAALSSLELLRKRLPPDPRHTPLVENALQALQRGAILTERMLTFARRQELTLGAVNIAGLVRGMHGFLQRSIGPTVRVVNRVPAGLPAARTDANQLETALLNLVINARDAMPDGGIVTLSGRIAHGREGDPKLGPGEYVVVSVTDSGSGMNPTVLKRATEPFFSTKGVGRGTGLGLSMVDGLAAQSGGALAIQSSEGEGTTVEIWLPLSTEPGSASGPTPDVHDTPDRQLVLLLVDDDPLVLANTAALLEDLGHFVLTANSGEEALAALRLHPDLDAVLTDYAMPRMTGLELADEVRRSFPDLPVIIVTGYADVAIPLRPNLRHLRKPFTQEQIQDLLVRALEPAIPQHGA